jgi:hypothetical protein
MRKMDPHVAAQMSKAESFKKAFRENLSKEMEQVLRSKESRTGKT